VFVAPGLVVLAAIAWSAFWFYAASQVDQTVDIWRAREAKAGRIYDCAKRHVAGFPFRLEVTCEGASVTLVAQTAQGAAAAPVTAQLGKILVVAQIYTPKLLIAEFTAPATLAERGQPPSLQVNWRTARSSIAGLPGTPERVALVFDDAAIDRIGGAAPLPLARATHLELHGRLAEDSTVDHPVIEAALQINGGSILDLHPLLAQPFDADIRAKVRGLRDFSPKPWPDRFREIQAAGGRIEITQSRIQQGDLISVAAGSLGLTANGRLDGELQMTVAGIEKVLPALGVEKMLEEGVPQATLDRLAPGVKSQDVNNLLGSLDRMIPGLGKVVRQNANAGVTAGINALGTPAELEGKKARSFPLRFVDGAVFLGPIKVGDTPPLF
jgi:hypothetical protein